MEIERERENFEQLALGKIVITDKCVNVLEINYVTVIVLDSDIFSFPIP